MKRLLILFAFVVLASFKTEQPKTYTLHFTQEEMNMLGYLLDNSTAPHNTVKQMTTLINQQLQSQIDTTKKK